MNKSTAITAKNINRLYIPETLMDFGGFRVEGGGLYAEPPHADDYWGGAGTRDIHFMITKEERSVVSWHPTGEYDKPALSFPCTGSQLRSFVDAAGLSGILFDKRFNTRTRQYKRKVRP